MTDTECDFPLPWTPHTTAEKGAFWGLVSGGDRVTILPVTYRVQVQSWVFRPGRIFLAAEPKSQTTISSSGGTRGAHPIARILPSTPYWQLFPASDSSYAFREKSGAVTS